MGFILTFIIICTAIIGTVCAFTNNDDISSSNIILGFLSILVFLHFAIFHLLYESANSIINTYCSKNYPNNINTYNKCKYTHKDNFSKVILKGVK